MHRLEEGKHGSQTMLSAVRSSKHSGDSNPSGGMGVSLMGGMATVTFLMGLVLFIVAFASTDWLGIDQGLALSLWRTCSKNYLDGYWQCHPWEMDKVPDFVRAAQGFCVVALLVYAVSLIVLVAYLALPSLAQTRGVLVALCLLTFSAGCMVLMALVVMGVKGRDLCREIKQDDWTVVTYLAEGVDTLGPFYVGWSFVVAALASLTTLASFTFCMVEFVRVNDLVPVDTEVTQFELIM